MNLEETYAALREEISNGISSLEKSGELVVTTTVDSEIVECILERIVKKVSFSVLDGNEVAALTWYLENSLNGENIDNLDYVDRTGFSREEMLDVVKKWRGSSHY